ncbi:MerR family transcriptional regulator [Pararhodobacter marinus]|uniref:MerR family transcriptional regulator n=1 Tax=Pararhodobacter marinus TaxID=2184063 RepID=UPI003510E227
MKKAPDAFRTISEVAEILDTPAHVLRFWESKFYQIRPVKRAGGRRYYRPDDVALINGIKSLLQEHHVTIRGVQRVLQEQGVKHVASLGGPLPALVGEDAVDETEDLAATRAEADPDTGTETEAETPPPLDEIFATRRSDAPAHEPVTDPDDIPDAPLGTEIADDEDTTEALDTAPETAPEMPETAPSAAPAEAPAAERSGEPADDPQAVVAETPQNAAAAQPGKPAPRPAPAPAAEPPVPADALSLSEPSERAQIARRLRAMKRGALGPQRDRADMLARRIDSLLERMSEASGAGRW